MTKLKASKNVNKPSDDFLGSSSKFRGGLSKIFVTYPHSGSLTKEDFTDDFNKKFKLKQYICVQEEHENGEPHLHLAVEFSNAKFTKVQILKYFKEKYTEYESNRIQVESIKSWKDCVVYLTNPKKQKYVDPKPYTSEGLVIPEAVCHFFNRIKRINLKIATPETIGDIMTEKEILEAHAYKKDCDICWAKLHVIMNEESQKLAQFLKDRENVPYEESETEDDQFIWE